MNEPARTAISRRPKVASIEHADTFVDKSRAVLTASELRIQRFPGVTGVAWMMGKFR